MGYLIDFIGISFKYLFLYNITSQRPVFLAADFRIVEPRRVMLALPKLRPLRRAAQVVKLLLAIYALRKVLQRLPELLRRYRATRQGSPGPPLVFISSWANVAHDFLFPPVVSIILQQSPAIFEAPSVQPRRSFPSVVSHKDGWGH